MHFWLSQFKFLLIQNRLCLILRASFHFGGDNLIGGLTVSTSPSLSLHSSCNRRCGEPKNGNRLRVLSVTYSGLAPFAPLAFVTLMHWLDNISGMVIPRFPPRCGITSYCLSWGVSQLLHSEGRQAWFPRRTTVGSGWISIQKAKSPLWWKQREAAFFSRRLTLFFHRDPLQSFRWPSAAVSALLQALPLKPYG